jgi:hypothetical protein
MAQPVSGASDLGQYRKHLNNIAPIVLTFHVTFMRLALLVLLAADID